jgi:hypothetical protein
MNFRNYLSVFLDPLVVLGAFSVGVILFISAVILLLLTRTSPAPTGVPTAAITLVAFPTVTPIPTSKPSRLWTQTPLPDQAPQPGGIHPGVVVQITGTGGDGLRLRVEPGLGSEILFIGSESEKFRVQDGPVEADDFIWWFLISPENSSRQGWAVSDYLLPFQSP